MKNFADSELNEDERVTAAIVNENSGNIYHRINAIRARCFDALVASVLGDEEKQNEC